jgi:hypothetical protein
MPIFSSQEFDKTPDGQIKFSPGRLAQKGPIIDVLVSIPQALAELYTKQSKTIPTPISGIGLIDTGATRSCVHEEIMKKLGVQTIGVATSGTAAGPVQHNLYPSHFTFPAASINIDFSAVIGVNLTGQNVEGKQIIALIGRDVLSAGIFIYNGHTGAFSIAIM